MTTQTMAVRVTEAKRPVPGVMAAALMAAGLGWIGGTYPWPDGGFAATALITLAHLVPVGVVVLAIPMVVADQRAGRIVLTVMACLIKAMTAFAIVWAITHPGGFGPHGFLDWVPIGLANAGNGLWFKSQIFDRRHGH